MIDGIRGSSGPKEKRKENSKELKNEEEKAVKWDWPDVWNQGNSNKK